MEEPKRVIQAALSDFKNNRSDAQIARFTATTLQHVQAKIQIVFEALEQFDDVTKSLNLGIPDMSAFIWGPTSSILQARSDVSLHTHILTTYQVAKEDVKALDSILTSYAKFGQHLPLLADYKAQLTQQPEMKLSLAWMYQDLLHFNSSLLRLFDTRGWRKTFAANWKDCDGPFESLVKNFDTHGEFLKKALARQQSRSIHETHRRLNDSIIQDQGHQDDVSSFLELYNKDRETLLETHRRLNDSIIQYQGDRDDLTSFFKEYRNNRETEIAKATKDEISRKETQYIQVVNWLNSPTVKKPETQYHSEFCGVRSSYPETGQWILETNHLRGWIKEKIPDHPILWICGKKGAGKTILASLIIDHLLDDTNLTAENADFKTSFFYCRESDETLGEPRFLAVLKSLLRQMVGHNRDLLPTLHEKIRGRGPLNDDKAAKTLIDLFGDIGMKQFIIIDGLDELPGFHRDNLVQFLDSFVARTQVYFPGHVRVLYLSTDVAVLRDTLKTTDRIAEYPLDPAGTGEDIKSYMVKQGDKLQKKFKLNDQQVERARELIYQRSNGMFLYAFLVSDNLLRQPNRWYVMKELEETKFPADLKQAYDKIIERLRTAVHANTWTEARKIFGWLAYAKRPLKWHELQAALSVNIDDYGGVEVQDCNIRLRESIQNVCGSLVHMPGGTSIDFIHQTAKEMRTFTQSLGVGHVFALFELSITQLLPKGSPGPTKRIWARKGYYALQDYAVSQWQSHLHAFIENSPTLFNDFGDSMTYRSKTAGVLQAFCDMYCDGLKEINEPQRETEAKDGNQAKENCQLFEQQDFHTNLLLVWTHVVRHQNQGFKERNKISVKQLDDVLKETRDTLEKLSSEMEDGGTVAEFYGTNAFKCTRITCDYFYEGFDNELSVKNHSNRHDRPFPCTVPECSLVPFGFSSNKDLEKHLRTYHPDMSDQLSGFAQLDRRVVPNAKFQCTLCQRSYTRNGNLKGHMNSAHLGRRPYACSTCGKEFARKNDRTRHEKIHVRQN